MGPGEVILGALGLVVAIGLGVVLVVFLFVPLFKGIGWLVRHLFRFVVGMFSDAFRLIGAILLAVVYVPMILGTVVIGRWSASGHYGRAWMSEVSTMGLCLYRIAIGHPLRLVGLGGVVEGLENRLPAAIANAPTADLPPTRVGQFEGYKIVGSLAPGGSGAKLYIADPDAAKLRQYAKAGFQDVGQVVIKSFSLKDGSTLPQLVRESRSLDVAKRMGLILDHELTPDRFHYAMRYVPGESLGGVAKRLHAGSPAGGLGEAELRSALGYLSDLVSTLSGYHRAGLWHKDVKPDNLMIDGQGRAHLVDFGLVSSLRSAMTLTTHGTEYFRDPEMVRLALRGVKVHEVDGSRFDIYGAGAVLYAVVEDSFPAHGVLSPVSKRCPEAVKWIIRRAMTDYDKRYVSAQAMLADLETVRRAADPNTVRPADLPSMAGAFAPATGFDEAEVQPPPIPFPAAAAAAVGAIPVGVAAAATPRPRSAPVIRVKNWWSGCSEVVGQQAAPAAPAGDVRFAGIPRRAAEEQIAAAKARIDSARVRINERFGKRIGAHSHSNGRNFGVAAAIFIFVGGLFGVGSLVVAGLEGDRAHRMQIARTTRINDGFPDDGPVLTHRVSDRSGRAREIVAPPPLPIAHGRVLMVNDLLLPWSDQAAARISAVADNLGQTGVELLGNVPLSDDPNAVPPDRAQAVELVAAARMALGQSPLDSADAARRFKTWLEEQAGNVDAVVWIAAGSEQQEGRPRVYAFVPEGGEKAELATAMRAALERAGGRESK